MSTWTSPDEKADLIASFMAHTGCDESTAREYLRAEDWLYTEAVWTWVNDRAAEYRAWYREQVEDAVSLAHLCGLLNDYDAEAGRIRLEFVVSLPGLPTFGGEAPTSIADVWSWDDTSLLYCNPDTRGYYIDKRPSDQGTINGEKYRMHEDNLALSLDLDTGVFHQSGEGITLFRCAACQSVGVQPGSLSALNFAMGAHLARSGDTTEQGVLLAARQALCDVYTAEDADVDPEYVWGRLCSSAGYETS